MKKWIVRISMVFALALMLSVTALAADGIQTPNVTGQNVTIVPDGTDKLTVTYSAAESGKEYLVIVTEGTGTPTEDNIVYIDQKTAEGSSVVFSVYPSALKNATYSVRISSNAASGIQELIEVGTFENKVSVTLGDVDNNGRVTTGDATQTLQHAVRKITLTGNSFLAADVTKDGRITTGDATKILQFAVKKITSFD